MKKRIVEWIVKVWLPGYKVARIRGPYKKKSEFISPPPEFSMEGKE